MVRVSGGATGQWGDRLTLVLFHSPLPAILAMVRPVFILVVWNASDNSRFRARLGMWLFYQKSEQEFGR